jgi:glycosyltransferase involved in cell wall biosynthesis
MLVSVSKGVDRYFSWLSGKKRRVIYNPFFAPEQQARPGVESLPDENSWMTEIQGPIVVSMGRFTRQKGFDILLKAFSTLAAAGQSDWNLIILGDGELRGELEQLVEDLGLSSRVIMPGRVKDPFSVLRHADLFVMSSRFEGFPMAHGEAMLCGLPVVATDCPSGPSELIRDGVDGILVENENQLQLEEAMQKLMSNAVLRRKMG